MESSTSNSPNTPQGNRPRQFTIRGLLIVTLCLSVVLTLYLRLPKWVYVYLQIALMVGFSLLMSSGLVLAFVDYFKRSQGRH